MCISDNLITYKKNKKNKMADGGHFEKKLPTKKKASRRDIL